LLQVNSAGANSIALLGPQKKILRATHENRGAQFLMLFSFTSVNTGIINVARVAVAGKRSGFEG
jgi:hypothetical protein